MVHKYGAEGGDEKNGMRREDDRPPTTDTDGAKCFGSIILTRNSKW